MSPAALPFQLFHWIQQVGLKKKYKRTKQFPTYKNSLKIIKPKKPDFLNCCLIDRFDNFLNICRIWPKSSARYEIRGTIYKIDNKLTFNSIIIYYLIIYL